MCSGKEGAEGPFQPPVPGCTIYRLLGSLPLGKMGEVAVSFLGGVEPEQCFRLVQ